MVSAMFEHREGDTAILRTNAGVFQQVDVYTRNGGELFVAVGRGRFVRLHANGATSKPGVMLDALILDADLTKDRFGRLCVGPANGRKSLDSAPEWLALEDKT